LCLFVATILIMRTLYYIPIIHTSADMGSLAKAVTERGISQIGERNWERHVNTVHRFWDIIAQYCASLPVVATPQALQAGLPAEGMKNYQDGLVAEGEIGVKIISAGAESGSRNYEIVLSLMRRGAQIVKTEDFKLVLEERDRILELVNAKNFRAKISAFVKYRFVKHGLLKRRDMFIAQRIAETLGDGDAGILFIGACHNVKSRLPKDIKVIEIKEAKKVRKYQELLPFSRRRSRRFAELGRYLAAEVVGRE